jgi:hypothetical protein
MFGALMRATPQTEPRPSGSGASPFSYCSQRFFRLFGTRAAILLLCACVLAAGPKNAAYAVVEGTVFHDPGLALAHAKIVIQLRDEPKSKKQQATANDRGEFEFRVPATTAVYVVKATMKGFHPDQKEAAIAGGAATGQERVTINLVLSPESK